MIGKIIAGRSFGHSVGYVMKEDATVLDAEGITPPNVKDMVEDFKDQTLLNPRVKNTTGHISLSFSENDKDKLTDKAMTDMAKEYMQKMGIVNTQYLIVRHHDSPHPHCHIVYNRVKNDGTTVPDSNIRLRNVEACKEITKKHGLYFATGKENVREHRLRDWDKAKYQIYHSIKDALPGCKSWNDLENRLKKDGISMEFKYKGNTGTKEGVKFTTGKHTISGSKIDKQFSFSKLDNYFNPVQKIGQTNTPVSYSTQSRNNLNNAVGGFLSALGSCFPAGGGKGSSPQADLSPLGGGSLPLPLMDSGIGLAPEQLQRQEGETPEHHIARITSLINSMTEAMISLAEERKRKQRQQKDKKQSKISM